MKIKSCIIPIAGSGTRLLPATKYLPKEMMIVVDRPLIEYAVEEARSAGIKKFIFISNSSKQLVEQHIDSLLQPHEAIYLHQSTPRGLGHAILCAEQLIAEEQFAVILPDDLIIAQKSCLTQMLEQHDYSNSNWVASMQVPRSECHHYGMLEVETISGSTVLANSIIEKPEPEQSSSEYAVIGGYILTQNIFNILKDVRPGRNDEIQLSDALAFTAKTSKLVGYLFEGQRFDCGTLQGWQEANRVLVTQMTEKQ